MAVRFDVCSFSQHKEIVRYEQLPVETPVPLNPPQLDTDGRPKVQMVTQLQWKPVFELSAPSVPAVADASFNLIRIKSSSCNTPKRDVVESSDERENHNDVQVECTVTNPVPNFVPQAPTSIPVADREKISRLFSKSGEPAQFLSLKTALSDFPETKKLLNKIHHFGGDDNAQQQGRKKRGGDALALEDQDEEVLAGEADAIDNEKTNEENDNTNSEDAAAVKRRRIENPEEGADVGQSAMRVTAVEIYSELRKALMSREIQMTEPNAGATRKIKMVSFSDARLVFLSSLKEDDSWIPFAIELVRGTALKFTVGGSIFLSKSKDIALDTRYSLQEEGESGFLELSTSSPLVDPDWEKKDQPSFRMELQKCSQQDSKKEILETFLGRISASVVPLIGAKKMECMKLNEELLRRARDLTDLLEIEKGDPSIRYYNLLGINPGSATTTEEIQEAFKKLESRNSRSPIIWFPKIVEAFECLSDPGKRERYDEEVVRTGDRNVAAAQQQARILKIEDSLSKIRGQRAMNERILSQTRTEIILRNLFR